MVYIGENGIHFRLKDYRCVFNGKFNVILSTNYSAILGQDIERVKFIVPVDYHKFLETVSVFYKIKDKKTIVNLFEFRNSEDKIKFQKYTSKLPTPKKPTKIMSLIPKKHTW